jgi:tRNA(fMet)-specific endonuclease VapC
MNGRIFLDTNAVIALMSGNYNVLQTVNQAQWIGISVISEIEFLSFPKLSQRDKELFQKFKSRIEVLDLQSNNESLLTEIYAIRAKYKVKLPDVVIAASAVYSEATLLSNDHVFSTFGIATKEF